MNDLTLPDSLVSVDWLHQHIDHPQLLLFDASWHMPNAERSAEREWREQRIKQARFFDFDRVICDPQSDLPHMMPSAESFTEALQKLGLNQNSRVVIYDSLGIFSSPRVWWMLRAMGFDTCAVLDGGLPAWQRAGYELDRTEAPRSFARGNFVARPVADQFCDAAAVLAALDDSGAIILDARSGERFRGEVEEPRAGLRKGHMPGANNLPFDELLHQGRMKSIPELEQILGRAIPANRRLITSCGSGITACVIAFAAHRAGYDQVSVYDGSWCEWGRPGELPVE